MSGLILWNIAYGSIATWLGDAPQMFLTEAVYQQDQVRLYPTELYQASAEFLTKRAEMRNSWEASTDMRDRARMSANFSGLPSKSNCRHCHSFLVPALA